MIPKNATQQQAATESIAHTKYIGTTIGSTRRVVVQTFHSKTGLRLRTDLVRNSATGFDWGSPSPGGAQLAAALLAHVSGDDNFALEHYQVFHQEIISRLPIPRWELSPAQVLQMLRFVCCGSEPEALTLTGAGLDRDKRAVIQAYLPGKASETEITVHGSGRSVRQAATRALLNLLGNKRLRRSRITRLQIALSITSTKQRQSNDQIESRDDPLSAPFSGNRPLIANIHQGPPYESTVSSMGGRA